MEKESLLSFDDFPAELKDFVAQNDIPPEAYEISQLHRFFRFVLSYESTCYLSLLIYFLKYFYE